jgi:putative molybdopterin biosynthesis protein
MNNDLGIHLRYDFTTGDQRGAEVEHPLFDLLAALQAHGSIAHAARALGRSYRHMWGEVHRWEEVMQAPLVTWSQGKRAELTPLALRLMWAERQARTRMTPYLEALRAELRHVLQQARDERFDVLELHASHDPQFGALAAMAEADAMHLSLSFTGSAQALRDLNDGACLLAGFHVPRLVGPSDVFMQALRPLLKPGVHKLIGSHSRTLGFMHRHDAPRAPKSVADLAPVSGGADAAAPAAPRFVNRQPGSGTRLLIDHLLNQAGIDAAQIAGYATHVESTHVAVAVAVASGQADVGIGVEAAAREHRLGFVPLVEEDYHFVTHKSALEHPLVRRFIALLASPAWASTMASQPGYGAHHAGEILSLTQALPWWTFKRARAGHRAPSPRR